MPAQPVKSSFGRYLELEKERDHLRQQLREAASRFEDAAAILDSDSGETSHMAGFFRASAKRYYREANQIPGK